MRGDLHEEPLKGGGSPVLAGDPTGRISFTDPDAYPTRPDVEAPLRQGWGSRLKPRIPAKLPFLPPISRNAYPCRITFLPPAAYPHAKGLSAA